MQPDKNYDVSELINIRTIALQGINDRNLHMAKRLVVVIRHLVLEFVKINESVDSVYSIDLKYLIHNEFAFRGKPYPDDAHEIMNYIVEKLRKHGLFITEAYPLIKIDTGKGCPAGVNLETCSKHIINKVLKEATENAVLMKGIKAVIWTKIKDHIKQYPKVNVVTISLEGLFPPEKKLLPEIISFLTKFSLKVHHDKASDSLLITLA
jgi:hypothetical protein